MPLLLPFAISVVLSAIGASRTRPASSADRYGSDLAGRRGPALCDGPGSDRPSLEDEARQGHVFTSASPA